MKKCTKPIQKKLLLLQNQKSDSYVGNNIEKAFDKHFDRARKFVCFGCTNKKNFRHNVKAALFFQIYVKLFRSNNNNNTLEASFCFISYIFIHKKDVHMIFKYCIAK